MKKIVYLLAIGLMSTACNDLEGVITVNSALTLKTKKELVTLPQGTVAAKFEFDQGDREIEIKFKNPQGKEKKAKVLIPAGVSIPTHSGTFYVKGAQSGQPFDLKGALNTDVQTGPSVSTTESCSYQVRVPVVVSVPVKLPNGQIVYKQQTTWRYVTRYGSREVRYHNQSTTVSGEAEFLQPGGEAVLALFSGSRSWSETIYEYKGQCWGHGRRW